MEHREYADMRLPVSVTSRVDVGRLLREAEAISDFLKQTELREPGSPVKMPKTSRLFDETIQINSLNVLHETQRIELCNFLSNIRDRSPVIHISFSADPSPVFVQKLVIWLRRNIHPNVLIQVGLQPNIGAGCTVRTNNRYFDFSLRVRLKNSRPELTRMMREISVPSPGPSMEVVS